MHHCRFKEYRGLNFRPFLTSIALVLCACFSYVAQAEKIHELYRGTRAMTMGGAYTAVADDEQMIFLNPAGLAGNKDYVFHYLISDTILASDFYNLYKKGTSTFTNASLETLNLFIGTNVYVQEQVTSSLMMPNFGIAVLGDFQLGITGENLALPKMNIGYQTTNGLQMAWGASLTRGFRNSSDFRVGVGAKMLNRRGGYSDIRLTELFTADTTFLSKRTGSFGRGYGLDLGLQYIKVINQRFKLSTALVFLNAGDVTFSDALAKTQKGALNAGVAGIFYFRGLKAIMSYDYQHILDSIDWRKKNHFGVEVGVPFFSIAAGINQTYLSYGGSLDFWLFRLTGAVYTEEKGSEAYMNPEPRWMARLSMKFNL